MFSFAFAAAHAYDYAPQTLITNDFKEVSGPS
jgi:hypothetical protein